MSSASDPARSTDLRIVAVLNENVDSSSRRPWTDDDDRFLIFYGRCVGHDFVAQHDLNRTPQEAEERMRWLMAHKPDLVAQLESEADKEP